MVVYCAVQFIELLVPYRGLCPYGCGTKILRQFNGPTHALDVDSLLITLSASPAGKLDYQRKTNDVYLQFAVYAELCLVTLQIALAGVVVLPRIQFSLSRLTKGEVVRLQFTLLIKLALLLYQPIDNVQPLLLQLFGSLSVAPSALLYRLRYYE